MQIYWVTCRLLRLTTRFLLAISLVVVSAGVVLAGTISVNPGRSSALSEAIDLAKSGDTVLIRSGTYFVSDLSVDKSITIIGESWPVISADTGNHVLVLNAPGVRVHGLVIRGAGVSFVNDNAGVFVQESHDCVVSGNRFENNFFAIYVAESYDCEISGNSVTGVAESETTSGNGIHLWYCRDVEVTGNTVSGHRDGIYFEFVRNGHISGNVSRENVRYGLHFMFSDSCRYENNKFIRNGAGVAVMYTHYVVMRKNVFEHNWGQSSYGLLLKEITDSQIFENTIVENSVGVYMEGCNRVTFERNDLIENGWALKLMANSMDNHFERNNFIGNSFQVATNSRQNFSHFQGNFWSDYSGYDLDRDGIGDIPFHPVRLFSLVVQQNPPTLVLMHSLMVQVLDLAEGLIPSLTPATLVDQGPAMERIP